MQKSLIRQIFDSALPGSINLGLGELQFPMPEYLHSEAVRILFEEDIRYTPNAGLLKSREAIAKSYHHANPEEVVITNGAQEALYATMKALLQPGDEILLPDPGFSAYASMATMMGVVPKFYKLDEDRNFALCNEALFAQFTPKVKAILVNTPGNPTSTALTELELNTIANFCKINDLYLISDQVYNTLYLETKPKSTIEFYDKTIVISSLSKSHCMTGWRVGWAIANPEITKLITVAHQYISTCANYLGQRLCEYAFNEQGAAFQRELRAILRMNYHIIHGTLTNVNLIKNDSAPYVFVNIRQDGFEFAKKMLAQKVIVIPGIAFSPRLPTWIRISYSLPQDQLVPALELVNKSL
ncbi:MAG: pyridoxal phosphate-dependent aminotransferase [Candidatus Cloacimonadales bacterium]